MIDICTPSMSRTNTSILNLLQAHLKENILVPSLVYFYCVCGTRSRPCDNKDEAGWCDSDHGHSVPSPPSEERGRKRSDAWPWRSRGQRFFPACRQERTYIFLRYDYRSASLHFFANRSRPIAEEHAPQQRWQRWWGRWRRRACSRQAGRTFSKILYSRRLDIRLIHSWGYPVELMILASRRNARSGTFPDPVDNCGRDDCMKMNEFRKGSQLHKINWYWYLYKS